MGVDCFQFRILHKRGIDARAFPWADVETITAARVAGSAGLGSGAGIKKAAEIVQICFAPSLLTLSSSLCLSCFLSPALSVRGADHARTAATVTGARLLSLRLASSFFVPLPLLGLGAALLPLSSSLCLSLRPSGTGGDAIPSSWGGSSWYGWRLVRCIQAR